MNKFQLGKYIIKHAIQRGEFTLASGLQTDIYVDKYQLADPEVFSVCLEQLSQLFDPQDFECIIGVELGGALLAHGLARYHKKHFLAIRKKPQDHGLGNVLEGNKSWFGNRNWSACGFNYPVLLVEDVITTGTTVKTAITQVTSSTRSELKIERVISVVNRDIDQTKTSHGLWMKEQDISSASIFQLSELI